MTDKSENDIKRLKKLQVSTHEELKIAWQQLDEAQLQLKAAQQTLEAERIAARREKEIHKKEMKHQLQSSSLHVQQCKQKIQKLEKSNTWLEEKLKAKEHEMKALLDEDKFHNIYSFFEGKSSTAADGDRCIICDKAPSKDKECIFKTQDGQQCRCPASEHVNVEHNFKQLSLCQSHLYPRSVLEVVCSKGNHSWIYDEISHKSCTPESCSRRLICCLCEPATSKLEEHLHERFDKNKHEILPKDSVLFSILAYRAMLFNLHHFSYRNKCCGHHRLNVKSILQYGWRCNDRLLSSRTCDITPPALLYLQPPVEIHSVGLSCSLHFPIVCELDFTSAILKPAPPPELASYPVLVIYGCIPPYHYVLLRGFEADNHMQRYIRQIVLSINKRLSKELKKLYEINDKAKAWLQGIRQKMGEDWWPVLTFGHLKCCLKIKVK